MKQCPRTDQIFEAILDYHDRHRMAPTIRELMVATGTRSTSNVNYHLKKLEAQGLIHRSGRWRARDIRVIGAQASNTAQEGVQLLRALQLDSEPIPGEPDRRSVSEELLDRFEQWAERVGA